jgi:hypothetical protein
MRVHFPAIMTRRYACVLSLLRGWTALDCSSQQVPRVALRGVAETEIEDCRRHRESVFQPNSHIPGPMPVSFPPLNQVCHFF